LRQALTDIHQEYLDDGRNRKKSDQKKEKRQPKPWLCPACKLELEYRAKVCLGCGEEISAASEVEEIDEELVEDDDGSMKSGKKAPATMEEKARFLAEALTFHNRVPNCRNRAAATFKDRFGVYPNSFGWVEPAAKCSFETASWIRGKQQQWLIANKVIAKKQKTTAAPGAPAGDGWTAP
jgi:hypothetical protein